MSSQPEYPRLQVERTPEGIVARVEGCRALNEQTTPLVQNQLATLAQGLGAGSLTVDLGGVELLTSIALGMLIGLHRRLRAAGGALRLCGLRESLYEVFEATRLDQLFEIRRQGPAGPAPP